MAAETELRELIASRREGVLGTIKRGGLPQLSNILYLPEPGGRTVRISTTADRLKARVLARDPRAVLHVTGDNFWAYAVAEGHATLTSAAADGGIGGAAWVKRSAAPRPNGPASSPPSSSGASSSSRSDGCARPTRLRHAASVHWPVTSYSARGAGLAGGRGSGPGEGQGSAMSTCLVAVRLPRAVPR